MKFRLLSLTCLVLSLTAARAWADDVGLDFTGGGAATPIQDQTLGWEFSISSTQTVSALGMFDLDSNGLSSAHLVGIWTTGGTLLGSTTVNNASTPIASSSAAGRWLFQNLGSPLVLGAGNYVLGVDYASPNTDLVMTGAASLTLHPALTFVQGRFVSSETPGFDFPDATFSTSGGHFGPNLLISAVPEPAAVALVGVGSLCVGYGIWRRRNSRQLERRIS